MNCTAIPSFEIAFPFPALPSSGALCVICSRSKRGEKKFSSAFPRSRQIQQRAEKSPNMNFASVFPSVHFWCEICVQIAISLQKRRIPTRALRGCASEAREMWRCVLLKATAELSWNLGMKLLLVHGQREAEHKAHLCLQRVTHSLPTRSFNLYNNHYSQPGAGTTQIICYFCAWNLLLRDSLSPLLNLYCAGE